MGDGTPEWPEGLRRRSQPWHWVLGVVTVFVALWLASWFFPACDRILDSEVPSFETVMPLAERAARGEPFKRKGAHWYQCKTRLERAFFF